MSKILGVHERHWGYPSSLKRRQGKAYTGYTGYTHLLRPRARPIMLARAHLKRPSHTRSYTPYTPYTQYKSCCARAAEMRGTPNVFCVPRISA